MTPLTLRNRRARVLHVGKFYPPYRGGMETHLRDLCRAISRDTAVSVIVSNSAIRTVHERDGDIPVERVGAVAKIASTPICPGMIRAIRQTPADVVHIHCPNPTGVLAYLASGHPGKAVITYQSDVVRQKVLRYGYDPFFNRVARRAQAIVCLSPNYIESSEVLEHFREKCRVIPHGIDPQRFRNVNPEAVREIRRRFGTRMVLGVGRLVYYKGFEYLIRAMANSDLDLVIIGDGPLREHLRSVARECGVWGRVHLLGEVDDVVPYYHAAQVFALPSVARSEAFGIVQLEAMACGTPVVNTALDTGVPFVSLDGVSGLTVPPANASALREALLQIIDNPGVRARFSFGARTRVSEQFTVEEMARRTLELYESILSEGTSAEAVGELAAATI